MRSYIVRIASGLLGFFILWVGADLLVSDIKIASTDILNSLTFIILGCYMIFYGFTGKTLFKNKKEH